MIALLLACCIAVPAEITIDTDTVTLGAIVAFRSGDSRAPLSLGSAPQPGLARRFQKQELIAKINSAGMPVDDLQFPESVLVRRKSQGLDPDEVSRLVRDAFERQFPDADISITSIDTPVVDLATGKIELSGGSSRSSGSIASRFCDFGRPGFGVLEKDIRENRCRCPSAAAHASSGCTGKFGDSRRQFRMESHAGARAR